MWWDDQECVYDWDDAEGPHDRLVIIGNGFDLECGLPTSYGDFVKYVSALEDIREGINDSMLRSLLAGAHLKQISSSATIRTLDDYFEMIQVQSAGPGLQKVFVDLIDTVFIREEVCPEVIGMVKAGYHTYCANNEAEMSTATLRDFFYATFSVRLFDNYWYRLFKDATVGNGWVDIESEIESVIWAIEDTMLHAVPRQKTLDDIIVCPPHGAMVSIIKDVFHLGMGMEMTSSFTLQSEDDCTVVNHLLRSSGITYRKLRSKLLDDLNDFVLGFEMYLRNYVEHMEGRKTPAVCAIIESLRHIESPEDTHVICFNYTSTLERMLKDEGIDIDVCYVNGRIGDGRSTCRLVLGMDEYLDDDSVRLMTDFAMFREYNQRIYKHSDSSYTRWLRRYENQNTTSHEVIVMGHSLVASDYDLLHRVFSLPSMRTAIFYKDDDSFSDLLANMTAIMGKNYLIERTASDKRTLKFVDQREL
jgi:hypothetical protein